MFELLFVGARLHSIYTIAMGVGVGGRDSNFVNTMDLEINNGLMCSYRKLRQNKHFQLMVGLCVSLLLLVIAFLVGVERHSKSDALCYAFALVIHYLLLSVFCWTSTIASLLYIQLVKVYVGVSDRAMKILVILSLGKTLRGADCPAKCW